MTGPAICVGACGAGADARGIAGRFPTFKIAAVSGLVDSGESTRISASRGWTEAYLHPGALPVLGGLGGPVPTRLPAEI